MSPRANSIPAFCKPPRTLDCGRRRLVSDEGAAERRRSMEDLTLPNSEKRLADPPGRRTAAEERT
jgi:hypothetical protein